MLLGVPAFLEDIFLAIHEEMTVTVRKSKYVRFDCKYLASSLAPFSYLEDGEFDTDDAEQYQ